MDDIPEIEDILLMDKDDLVRKGCGWMLKAASQANQQAIFEYNNHPGKKYPGYEKLKAPQKWGTPVVITGHTFHCIKGYIQIQNVLFDDEPSIDNSMLYDESLLDILKGFGDQISYTVPRI